MKELFSQRLNRLRGLSHNVSNSASNANINAQIDSSGIVEPFAYSTELLTSPVGLAYDSVSRILYCSNIFEGTIVQINSSGTVIPFASGLISPFGLAYDSVSRILYCSDNATGTIVQINSSGTVIPFASGLTNPIGLAYDSVSRILYCCLPNETLDDGNIIAINSSGDYTTIASGLNFPFDLAYDYISKKLYCSNPGLVPFTPGNNTVVQIDPVSGNVTSFTNDTEISSPFCLAMGDKYLYITSFDNNTIYRSTIPSCYNEGTLILALNLNKNLQEEYVPIENLRIGDLVKTYKHGYRKIEFIGKKTMMNNPSKWNNCMYKMKKTEENKLMDELIITGDHSILVNELSASEKVKQETVWKKNYKIDDKFLLMAFASEKFTKLENTNKYTYYHLTLENEENEDNRYGIWANGILSETTFKSHFLKQKYNLLK